ncbi:MAG: alpha-L-fucosidase [Bacteroidetes bacterium]|nr:alpha-L-fucosidase [Bacteroidota bacterium]MBT6685580.1 alpha-L-fucosidase [Bacteroidota bacterium]MBT7144468.1 alpha-L-fucosidase [Bacteroidota bacterium]MBT7492290.1 alpha-L-fucosidase [Bacteroidota bacterium]
MRKIVILTILAFSMVFGQAQNQELQADYHKKMEWFQEAKLGIFIHWGIYSVLGIGESWSFFNGYISHEDYLKQAEDFDAKNYDPEYWASLIKKSGAKYSVITTKHHDGFALWDTKFGNFNSVNNSPAKEDLIAPFVKTLRNNDIKVGLYYSLPDWSYADYTHFTRKVNRYKIEDEPKRWAKFEKYYHGQMKELKKKFDPDVWWFDGDWEHSAEEWKVTEIKNFLSKDKPEVIFNSRLRGKGDYATPEIGMPIHAPKADYWELCMTMNDSWGYQSNDKHYKSPQQIIDIFVECLSKGGNLLLDIGPKSDGTIPAEQENILTELGTWVSKHKEAIYKTKRGIPYEYYYGPTALSKDSTELFLYLRDIPKDGKIVLRGIENKIHRAHVVGNGTILNREVFCNVWWSKYPGLIYIDIPENVIDKYYTVIAIKLDGKIKLYDKKSKAIESN